MQIPQITPEQARPLVESGQYKYLDVRTVPEFNQGHVPGALNIPVAEFNPAVSRLEFNPAFLDTVQRIVPKDANIVVGCKSGGRSQSACELVRQAGYANVVNLDGGFGGVIDPGGAVVQEGWETLGFPVERGDGGEGAYSKLTQAIKK